MLNTLGGWLCELALGLHAALLWCACRFLDASTWTTNRAESLLEWQERREMARWDANVESVRKVARTLRQLRREEVDSEQGQVTSDTRDNPALRDGGGDTDVAQRSGTGSAPMSSRG